MVSAIERFQCIKILFLRKWHNLLFFICFLIFYRNYDVVCRQNLDDVTLEQVMVQTLVKEIKIPDPGDSWESPKVRLHQSQSTSV